MRSPLPESLSRASYGDVCFVFSSLGRLCISCGWNIKIYSNISGPSRSAALASLSSAFRARKSLWYSGMKSCFSYFDYKTVLPFYAQPVSSIPAASSSPFGTHRRQRQYRERSGLLGLACTSPTPSPGPPWLFLSVTSPSQLTSVCWETSAVMPP